MFALAMVTVASTQSALAISDPDQRSAGVFSHGFGGSMFGISDPDERG